MKDLLKILPIYGVSFVAQIMFNFVNFTYFISRLKTGVYTIKVFDKLFTFNHWWTFTIAVWFYNAPVYIVATVLVAWAYVMSVRVFGDLSSGIIVGTIAYLATSLFFVRLRAGELPTRNGWIAIAMLILVSFFAAHSGKNV